MAHNVRVQPIMAEGRVRQLATLSLQLGSRGRWTLMPCLLSSLCLVQELSQCVVPPTSGLGLPCLIKPFWNYPHRHGQSYVTTVILNPITWTVNFDHDNPTPRHPNTPLHITSPHSWSQESHFCLIMQIHLVHL